MLLLGARLVEAAKYWPGLAGVRIQEIASRGRSHAM
jgi:hypothetical protein